MVLYGIMFGLKLQNFTNLKCELLKQIANLDRIQILFRKSTINIELKMHEVQHLLTFLTST